MLGQVVIRGRCVFVKYPTLVSRYEEISHDDLLQNSRFYLHNISEVNMYGIEEVILTGCR